MKPSARDYAKALYELMHETDRQPREILQAFLVKLTNNHDRPLLPIIIMELETLAAAAQGKRIVEVTSAEPLTSEQREAIVAALSVEGGVELREAVDPSIIGGLVIRIGDRTIDHSIKTKLETLTHQLAV